MLTHPARHFNPITFSIHKLTLEIMKMATINGDIIPKPSNYENKPNGKYLSNQRRIKDNHTFKGEKYN